MKTAATRRRAKTAKKPKHYPWKGEEKAEVERQWGQANSEAAGRPLGREKEDLDDEREQYNSEFHKIGQPQPERGPYGYAGEKPMDVERDLRRHERSSRDRGASGELALKTARRDKSGAQWGAAAAGPKGRKSAKPSRGRR